MAGESRRTVLVALGSNLAVAAAKFVGAFLTGSAALFAQSAQSVSDTLNEIFLLTSLRRSRRPADARHPFGYGKERFFWSFLAAVGIFVAGAGFSSIEAYRAFSGHETVNSHYFVIAYAVLGFVLLAEGSSFLRAMHQVRLEARHHGKHVLEHVLASNDPSVKTVAAEDAAALVGIGLAAGGIALHQLTGQSLFEGVSAAAIALLLVVTALALGNDVKDLLIGEAADPEMTRAVRDFLMAQEAVDDVVDLLTMQIGTDAVMLAARIDLDASLDSDAVELVSAELDHAINDRWPEVSQVFLDATRSNERIKRVSNVARPLGDEDARQGDR